MTAPVPCWTATSLTVFANAHCGLVLVSLWRRYGWPLPYLVGWGLVVAFALATTPIFRAGSLEAAWHVYQGLAILPDPDWFNRGRPILLAALVAFALPASQDIVAWLNEQPRAVVAAALGIVVVALLVELGDQDAYEFVYFQF